MQNMATQLSMRHFLCACLFTFGNPNQPALKAANPHNRVNSSKF